MNQTTSASPGVQYTLLAAYGRPLILALADMLVLFGVPLLVGATRVVFASPDILSHLPLLPLLLLAPLYWYWEGLYNAASPPPPLELRDIALGVSAAYLALALALFTLRLGLPSRLVILASWVLTMGLIPFTRHLVRKRFAAKAWWGCPVCIFGPAAQAEAFARMLLCNPKLGFKPLGLVCEGQSLIKPENPHDIPLLQSQQAVAQLAAQYPGAYAIVLGNTNTVSSARELLEELGATFATVLLVLDYSGDEPPLWMELTEVGNHLALRLRQNLLDPRRLALKRTVDVLCAGIGGLLLLPLLAYIALRIRMESPGPVLFRQNRIGQNGKTFSVCKFRTMAVNAEALLQQYLAENPAMREEWEKDQKLRHDPRVTRIGDFLRRTSLDELPQLWNVMKGEMSLVGPRPIVNAEIAKYGPIFSAYTRVKPGMTGLWQVSGRNDTTYAYRVQLDHHYICNWSICMDIWILARTIPVVLHGSGAY